MKLLMIKSQGGVLMPADEEAIEALTKIKNGDSVLIEYKRNRNPKFHRKMFALLKLIFENQSVYETQEELRREMMLKAGRYSKHFTTKGVTLYIPDSMSFDSMDQDEFEELYKAFIDIGLQHFLTNMDREQIERELLNFM